MFAAARHTSSVECFCSDWISISEWLQRLSPSRAGSHETKSLAVLRTEAWAELAGQWCINTGQSRTDYQAHADVEISLSCSQNVKRQHLFAIPARGFTTFTPKNQKWKSPLLGLYNHTELPSCFASFVHLLSASIDISVPLNRFQCTQHLTDFYDTPRQKEALFQILRL